MPNRTTNTIHIQVPKDQADNLREALRGPAYHWAMDGAYATMDNLDDLSNHELLKISEGSDSHTSAKQAYLAAGMPEWMNVGPLDVKAFLDSKGDLSKHLCVAQIPISLAKHRPWSGPEEYAAQRSDLLNFQYAVFGCKWSLAFAEDQPGEIPELEAWETDTHTQFHARCDTAWGPPTGAPGILQPVLARHSARMIWLYVNEGNEGAGCMEVDAEKSEIYNVDEPKEILRPDDPDDPDDTVLDEDALAEDLISQGASAELVKEVLGN